MKDEGGFNLYGASSLTLRHSQQSLDAANPMPTSLLFLCVAVLGMASGIIRAAEPATPPGAEELGISAEAKKPETGRVLSVGQGRTVTLHLRNDTGGPAAYQALAGDCTSDKAVLRSEEVLTEVPKSTGGTTLTSWLLRSFVYPEAGGKSAIFYVARPGESFDVVLSFTALHNVKDFKSPHEPLSPGKYRVFLDLFRVKEMTSAAQTGLPPQPLLAYIVQIP